nr:fumagillin dodecapentaenoate synthase [Quercus suber]
MLRLIITSSVSQHEDANTPLSSQNSHQLIPGLAYPLPANATDLARGRRFRISSTPTNRLTALTQSAIVKAVPSIAISWLCVTKLLRLETDMEPAKPFMSCGLDSLSAGDLRSRVRSKLGAELSTLDTTNAKSLVSWSEKVVAQLSSPAGGQK